LSSRAITSLEDYQALFHEGFGRTALGEASSAYLYYPAAAERPASARYPKPSSLSSCAAPPTALTRTGCMRAGREVSRFPILREALDAEPERISAGWSHFFHYRAKGWYFRQLSHWMSVFPREQFLLNLYEDLQQDPAQLMRRIFQFIGVDPDVSVDTQSKFNVSGGPMGVRVQRLLRAGAPLAHVMLPKWLRSDLKREILRVGMRKKNRMPQSVRQELLNDYAPDIRQLSDLIERDLSSWLESGSAPQLIVRLHRARGRIA
jgi:hypothetical protein